MLRIYYRCLNYEMLFEYYKYFYLFLMRIFRYFEENYKYVKGNFLSQYIKKYIGNIIINKISNENQLLFKCYLKQKFNRKIRIIKKNYV